VPVKRTIPGPLLREWLDTADLSQAQLAKHLHVDAGQVSRWCRDHVPLRGAHAAAVIALMRERGVTVEPPAPGHRIFLSTPMAALDGSSYEADRAAAATVHDALAVIAAPVYWPAGGIGSAQQFEAPDLATDHNLTALGEAEAFVYLQLRTLIRPTSCHVEIGMAIALQIPVTVFAPSEDALPYMLRRFEATASRAGVGGRYRFYPVDGAADAVRLLTIHGPDLLGLPSRIPERR
jgi:hypothetical protein